jgi:hypothetical protein
VNAKVRNSFVIPGLVFPCHFERSRRRRREIYIFFKKILAVPKKFLPLQSRLTKAGFFDQIFENTERLKVQASTEKL